MSSGDYVADGLSALAVERNAIAVLAQLLPLRVAEEWRACPNYCSGAGKGGVGDAIGPLLGARLGLVLIGEGLDSLRPTVSEPI